MDEDNLPAIERERMARIRRNREAMRALGVIDAAERVASTLQAEQAAAAAAAAAAVTKYNPSPGAPARRSSRSASRSAAHKLAKTAAAHETDEEASESDAQQSIDTEGTSDITGAAIRKRKAAGPLQPGKRRHKQQQQAEEQEHESEQEYLPTGSDTDAEGSGSPSDGSGAVSEGGSQEQQRRQAQMQKKPPCAQRRANRPAAASCAEAAAAIAGDGAADCKSKQNWVPTRATEVQLDNDDWEMQLAVQLSMQDNSVAPAAGTHDTSAVLTGASAAGTDKPAVRGGVLNLVSEVDAAISPATAAAEDVGQDGRLKLNDKQQQQRQQQLRPSRGSKCHGNASREEQTEGDAEAETNSGTKARSTSKRSKKPSKCKAKTGSKDSGRKDWSAADMFDLFAMFEPGQSGAIGRNSLLQQMAKAGMDADGDLAERMLQYAKDLASKEQALAGLTHASSSRMQLEYEEFLVLGQLMG